MSTTIDQRVVEMRFDNKQFESNVQTSMSTIDKLKQKLNFTGATKGLENISDAAKKVNMTGLGTAVEAVQAKFSALEVMGVTALANITNSAINSGKKIVSALTIDPIKTGFQEYETQMNAIQTILANTQSKGSTLSDVNAALDELNTYADQTIYNFTEMTRNIGTFTAAGVDLDKSVTSIKGIANLAAVSGSNATQASTAMYQLSQALAAGKVSLMDWNSVVNAGMGGQVFQDALKRTATQMGYNVDALIEKYGSFRESLTEGQWLTADVLTETLTQLSGAYTEADLIAQGYSEQQAKEITQLAQTAVDAATKVKTFTQLWDTLKEAAQSGWTQTWEILVGDFEEAKDLLTELSETFGEIIGKQAEARNTLLYDSMTSNWKKITDGLTEAGLSAEDFKDKIEEIGKSKGLDIDSIVADYGSLESAFKNGALSSDLLNEALLKMTGTSEEISKKMEELQGKYKTNKDILNALTKAGYEQSDIQELITKDTEGQAIALNDLSDAQLMSIGYTADQVKSIRELANYAELAGGSLKTFMDNVTVPQGREMLIDALRVSLRSLISIFERVGMAWREVFPPTTADQVLSITQSIRDFALAMRPSADTLDKLQRTFRGLFSVLSIGKQAVSALLSPIGTLLGNFAGLSGGVLDVTASFGDWLYSLNESMKAGNAFTVIGDGVSAVLNKIFEGIRFVIDGLGGLSGVFSSIGEGISNVFKGVFDVVSQVVNWIRENISAGDIFAGLAGGGIFMLVKKLGGLIDKFKDLFDFGGGLEDMGGKFGDILDSVHGSLEAFQQGIQVASLVGIAGAVTLLVSSLRKISEIEPTKIGYSLVTIRLLIAALNSGFKSLVKTLAKFNSKGTLKAALSMIAIAEAVNILASAMEKVAELDFEEISKGLLAIGALLIELSVSIKIISGTGGVTLRTSAAILALAYACKILSEALSKFSELSWDEIGRGLTAMGGALAEFTVVLSILSKAGGFGALLGGTGVLIAAQSLDEISENLERLGGMDWDEIGKGLVAMGGALLEFSIALGILSKIGGFGSILGGTAILIAVQSLDEISENLKRLGNMDWDNIGRGLAAIGGALAEFTVALGVLSKVGGFGAILGGTAILIAVQSLDEISENLKRLGDMTWDEIGKGLAAMGGALLEVGAISGALGKIAGLSGIFGAGAILIAIQGLDDLANALQKFGLMTWDEIGRGLTAMGGALLEVGAISGALGWVGGVAGLVGAGTLLLAIQGLDDLANALKKFAEMSWDEIGRGLTAMGAAMSETAIGGLLNTFSGFGAAAIAEIAQPLGDLADSIKKWAGVTVPEGLGAQIGSLATGISAFNFSGWGADAIAAVAVPIGSLADSIAKWQNIAIPETLSAQLSSLATGVSAFNFSGWGADAIAEVAPALGTLADSIAKWQTVEIPEELPSKLGELANGIDAFSFAFVGAWSIDALVGPLGDLADSVRKWDGVDIPWTMGPKLTSLAEGCKSFNLSLFGNWDVEDLIEPLGDLADSVKKWDGVNISYLGPQLTNFSEGLKNLKDTNINEKFSNNISAFFNVFVGESITTAVTNINTAVDALNNMSSINTDNVTKFGTALENLGKIGIGGLATSFQDASSKVENSVSSMIAAIKSFISSANITATSGSLTIGISIGTSIVSGLRNGLSLLPATITAAMSNATAPISAQNKLFQNAGVTLGKSLSIGVKSSSASISESFASIISGALTSINGKLASFNTAGKNLMVRFIAGIQSNKTLMITTFTTILTELLKIISNRYQEFNQSGQTIMTKFTDGMSSKESAAKNLISNMISSIASTLKSHYRDFYSAGENLVRGFIDGMEDHMDDVRRAARALAREAYREAMDELDEHSPSRKFMRIGEYVAVGFANGIQENERLAGKSARSMANTALTTVKETISKMADVINDDIDTQPTIRPVLDLSDLTSGTARLNALFSRNQALAIGASMNNRSLYDTVQNGTTTKDSGASFQFVQNNYSPKALSRVEIYRQTNNQFSAFERKVRA